MDIAIIIIASVLAFAAILLGGDSKPPRPRFINASRNQGMPRRKG